MSCVALCWLVCSILVECVDCHTGVKMLVQMQVLLYIAIRKDN